MNLEFLWYILYIAIGFFVVEIIVSNVVFFVKGKFPWLFLDEDEKPELSKNDLKKFFLMDMILN